MNHRLLVWTVSDGLRSCGYDGLACLASAQLRRGCARTGIGDRRRPGVREHVHAGDLEIWTDQVGQGRMSCSSAARVTRWSRGSSSSTGSPTATA